MAEYLNRAVGTRLSFPVTASSTDGAISGDNPYSADSTLSQAVVHAGVLTAGATASIAVEIQNGLPEYAGTTRNGVSSEYRPQTPFSYRILSGNEVASTRAGAAATRAQLRIQGSRTRSDLVVGTIDAGTANANNPPVLTYETLGRIRRLELIVRGGVVVPSFVPSISYKDSTTNGQWVSIPASRSVFIDVRVGTSVSYQNVAATATFAGSVVARSTGANASYLIQETYTHRVSRVTAILQPTAGALWPFHPQTNHKPLGTSPGVTDVTRQYMLTLPTQLGGRTIIWEMRV